MATAPTPPWQAQLWPQGHAARPWLVWLHGLLGDAGDWSALLPRFAGWRQAALTLPGHGVTEPVEDFEAVSQGLSHTLASLQIERYILIGYSLGGRIALYHACRRDPSGLCALFVEGANPGLPSLDARGARLRHDREWAQRFRSQPLAAVLYDWYRQPVFSDLTHDERLALMARRAGNQGAAVAAMLEATSLGRQPDLLPALGALRLPFGYLCGERDQKFTALARRAALPLYSVPGAGHNAHRANPSAFADRLLSLLAPFY